MSLAASNGILRTDAIGRGQPAATLLWSEPSRAYHHRPDRTGPTMCIRNVRAGADPATNKRPAYETTTAAAAGDQPQALLYRQQHRAPADDVDYAGGRESKLRRLSPPFPADEQPGSGAPAAAAAAPWATQQRQPHYGQEQQLMEDAEPLGGGSQLDNPRLKRNKPVKWSAEEDRRLREAVVRVSGGCATCVRCSCVTVGRGISAKKERKKNALFFWFKFRM